jgi:hypothetical protein
VRLVAEAFVDDDEDADEAFELLEGLVEADELAGLPGEELFERGDGVAEVMVGGCVARRRGRRSSLAGEEVGGGLQPAGADDSRVAAGDG